MFVIFLVSVAHAVISLLNKSQSSNPDGDYSSGDWERIPSRLMIADDVLLGVALLLWSSVLVCFGVVAKRAENTSSASGQLRESARRRSERQAAKRAQDDAQEDAPSWTTSKMFNGSRSSM